MYGRQIEGLIYTGVNYINKPDFLIVYVLAREESIAINIVYSGFAATGLVPYNPNRVLSKLNTQLRTPILPPPIVPD